MENPQITSFRIAKVFSETDGHPISSLAFSDCGEYCLVGSRRNESIHLYDCTTGTSRKQIYSRKYGVDLIAPTHSPHNLIHTGGDSTTIRYLSLHDNAYLRYFCGHEKRITALEMSPLDDTFISAAPNDSLRIWDLRDPQCCGSMEVTTANGILASIDPQGLVFAVALDSRHLRFFDMKSYEKGPFAMFEIVDATSSASQQNQWTRLTFSPDGRNLLVTTANGSLLVIDAFEGHVRQVIRPSGGLSKMPLPADASFTPDARHLIHGADGKISAWDAETGRLVGELEAVGHAKGLPLMVRMNPRFCMMASACTQLAFWMSNDAFS